MVLFSPLQVLIVILSAVISPATPKHLYSSPPSNYIQLYCQFSYGFLVSCIYNFVIIIACCYFALKARKVPSNFNESKFIGISVYSTLIVCLAAVPVYSTAIYVIQKVATLCMALLLNAYLSLVCAYIPKLYAIKFVEGGLDVFDWRTENSNVSRLQSRVHPSIVGQ